MASPKPPSDAPEYRDPNGEYVPISLEGLNTGLTNDFELYVKAGEHFFLVKPKNVAASPSTIEKYKGKLPYLYIRAKDREAYFKRIDSALAHLMKDPAVSVREKAAILTDCAVEIIDQLFSDPGNPKTIEGAKNFTQECVVFVGQNQLAFLHLVELSNHDHYTYAHSVGVAAYTIALASSLGTYSPQELSDIGMAGLLHDIGKCMVDPGIINKKGPLNEDEWMVMKKHPEYGGEILRRHKGLASIIAVSAEAHHESLLGTGYPKKLRGLEIDPIVRIVSLADAFSAMTTRRSYSKPHENLDALKIIKENVDKKFDAELFKRFVSLFLDPTKKAA